MHLLLILGGLGAIFALGLALVPWRDPAARRRALWLLLLPAPAIVLFAAGPMGLWRARAGAQSALVLQMQHPGVLAAAALAIGLVALAPGLRRASLVLGGLAIFAAAAVAGANELILAPRS
ncbi:MAG: hypothetical protein WDN45_04300 [Caulobacteraceae bacterium]